MHVNQRKQYRKNYTSSFHNNKKLLFIVVSPDNVPRLFDLVKTKDENILPAFYFALRDTLVANDMDQATRIAYGKTRFRVVTLQGQLIDMSGNIQFNNDVLLFNTTIITSVVLV